MIQEGDSKMAVSSDDLTMLRDAARAWIGDEAPVSRFRALRADGGVARDRATWATMARMGWAGALVPEAFGGSGFGYQGVTALIEECGRELVAVPLLTAGLGAVAALSLAASAEQQAHWLPRIADGSETIVLAVDGKAPAERLSARRSAAGWLLSGTIECAADVGMADRLIVAASDEADDRMTRLFLIDASSVVVRQRRLVDSRDHARIELHDVAAAGEAAIGSAIDAARYSELIDRLCIGLAAEMLGSAQRAFDMGLEYLRTREQFGRLIGSFQALQHRASSMLCEIELLRATVEAAAMAADGRDRDLPALAAMAKSLAAETVHLVMAETLQFHGGIGMTDAHDIGLYLKRGRVTEMLYGSAADHRARYAAWRHF